MADRRREVIEALLLAEKQRRKRTCLTRNLTLLRYNFALRPVKYGWPRCFVRTEADIRGSVRCPRRPSARAESRLKQVPAATTAELDAASCEPVSRLASRARNRLPLLEPFGNQHCALLLVARVEDAQVLRIRPPVHAGRARVQRGFAVRSRDPVPRAAIGGFQLDLTGAFQLRRVGIHGPLALPVVEDGRPVTAFLGGFAPVPCRERAVLLPGTAGELQPALRSRVMRSRLTAEGSRAERSVREYCHHSPSIRGARTSLSMAVRSFWLIAFMSAAVVVAS